MKISSLRQLFSVDTHRQRADNVGFSVPVLMEIEVSSDKSPFLVTNMRETFTSTRISSNGSVRFAFSEILLENEDQLLVEFVKALKKIHVPKPLEQAYLEMKNTGALPHTLVTPYNDFKFSNLKKILRCPLLKEGLLVSHPDKTGLYTRIGDHVGVLAYNVDTLFSLVEL